MACRVGVVISAVIGASSSIRVVRKDDSPDLVLEDDLGVAADIVVDVSPQADSDVTLLGIEADQTPPPVFCMNQYDTRRAWWTGQMRSTWKFEAPGSYVIAAFNSSWTGSDRSWSIGYNEISPLNFLDKSTSFWTAWTPLKGNRYMSCGSEHIITGMESMLDRGDRRYRFKCSKTWSLRYQMDPRTSVSSATRPTGSFSYASPSFQHVLFAVNSLWSSSTNTRYFTFSAARYCYNP